MKKKNRFLIYTLIVMGSILIITNSCKKNETPKINPVIHWLNPEDIIVGTLLSEKQLNASANVTGTFVYTPALGTKLNVGIKQDLKVDFTPTDAAIYNAASKTVKINVLGTTITGNVFDSITSDPISGAMVVIFTKYWWDEFPLETFHDLDSVLTNSDGYFEFPMRNPNYIIHSLGHLVGIVVTKKPLYLTQRFVINLYSPNSVNLKYSSTVKLNISHNGSNLYFDMYLPNLDKVTPGIEKIYINLKGSQINKTFFVKTLGNSNWSNSYYVNNNCYYTTPIYCPNFDTVTYNLIY